MAYIADNIIEEDTLSLLAEFTEKYGQPLTAPVPIEDLLEFVYGICPETAEFPDDDILAHSSVDKNGKITMQVNSSIYPYPPYNNQKQAGRFHFSLAHEVGHIRLHLPEILAAYKMDDLFDGDAPKEYSVYRKSEEHPKKRKEQKEIQADIYAKLLLMPQSLILQEWEKMFGPDSGPQNVFKEMEELRQNSLYPDSVRPKVAKDLAAIFEVSAEAMQYRLEKLHLIETQEQLQGSLF